MRSAGTPKAKLECLLMPLELKFEELHKTLLTEREISRDKVSNTKEH